MKLSPFALFILTLFITVAISSLFGYSVGTIASNTKAPIWTRIVSSRSLHVASLSTFIVLVGFVVFKNWDSVIGNDYDVSRSFKTRFIPLYVLGISRLSCGLIVMSAIICNIFIRHESTRFVFYLTNLCGISITLYLLLSSFVGFFGNLEKLSRQFILVHHHLYTTNFILQPLVSIFYWTALRRFTLIKSSLDRWVAITLHGFPLLPLLAEFLLTEKSIFHLADCCIALICLSTYAGWVVFGGLLHWTTDSAWIPYEVLDGPEDTFIYSWLILAVTMAISCVSFIMHKWKLKYTFQNKI